MGNNELLLGISDILDEKIERIISKMDEVENRLSVKLQDLSEKNYLAVNYRNDNKEWCLKCDSWEMKFVDMQEIDKVTERVLSIPVNYTEEL